MKRNKKGFTIVELVIVIGVIGILSAILIPTFASLNDQAEKARLQSDLHNAFSMYAADAADGKFGDEGAALTQKAQDQVYVTKLTTLSNGNKAYEYDATDGRWEEVTVSGAKVAVTDDTNYKGYLGYYIYVK